MNMMIGAVGYMAVLIEKKKINRLNLLPLQRHRLLCREVVRKLHIQNVSNYVNESAGHLARRGGKNWVKITNSQSPEHKGIWNGKCEISYAGHIWRAFLWRPVTGRMGQNLLAKAPRYGRRDSIYCSTTQILAGRPQPDDVNGLKSDTTVPNGQRNFGYERDGSRGKVSHTDRFSDQQANGIEIRVCILPQVRM